MRDFQSKFRDCEMAASLGLEPRQNDSESFVLPLHHEAKVEAETRCGGYVVKHFLVRGRCAEMTEFGSGIRSGSGDWSEAKLRT